MNKLAEMLKVTPEAFLKELIKAVKEDWIPRISENYWPLERD